MLKLCLLQIVRLIGFMNLFLLLQVEFPKVVCATVALGTAKKNGDADSLLERIVAATYDKCRANPSRALIPNFPDFGPLLAQMSETTAAEGTTDGEYQVTVLHPSGALLVKEPFFDQFENEIPEFNDVIQAHNSQFNKDGMRLARDTAAQPPPHESRVESCATVRRDEPLTAEKLAGMNLSEPEHPHVVLRYVGK